MLGDEKYHKEIRLKVIDWLSKNEKYATSQPLSFSIFTILADLQLTKKGELLLEILLIEINFQGGLLI